MELKEIVDENGVPYKNKSCHSKLMGSTFRGGAKEVILTLEKDMALELVREPNNPYDPNAIKIMKGIQIGYVKKELAVTLAPLMDVGRDVTCVVSEVTGLDKKNQGVNLYFTWDDSPKVAGLA